MNLVANRINFMRGGECAQTTTVCLFMFCSRLCVTARVSIPTVNFNCFLTIQIIPSGNTLHTPPCETREDVSCLFFFETRKLFR